MIVTTPLAVRQLADNAYRGNVAGAMGHLKRLATLAGYITKGSWIATNPADEDVYGEPKDGVAIAHGWKAFAQMIAEGRASRVVARMLTAERYSEGLAEDFERREMRACSGYDRAEVEAGKLHYNATAYDMGITFIDGIVAHRSTMMRIMEEARAEDDARSAAPRQIDPTTVPHRFNPMGTDICRTILGGRHCHRTAEAHVVIDADYALEARPRLYWLAAHRRMLDLGYRGRNAVEAANFDLYMQALAEDVHRREMAQMPGGRNYVPRAVYGRIPAVLAPQLH